VYSVWCVWCVDLDEPIYVELLKFSRKVAKALEKTISCERIGMSVIGLEVPHVHVHLIPINEMREMTFEHKVTMEASEFEALAQQIQQNLEEPLPEQN